MVYLLVAIIWYLTLVFSAIAALNAAVIVSMSLLFRFSTTDWTYCAETVWLAASVVASVIERTKISAAVETSATVVASVMLWRNWADALRLSAAFKFSATVWAN